MQGRRCGSKTKQTLPTVSLMSERAEEKEDNNMFPQEITATLTTLFKQDMSADAAVHQVIQPGEPFPADWKGGGGTNFIPALKAAEDYQPNCIVYLTDGAGTYDPRSN
jgi:hypothetical protein